METTLCAQARLFLPFKAWEEADFLSLHAGNGSAPVTFQSLLIPIPIHHFPDWHLAVELEEEEKLLEITTLICPDCHFPPSLPASPVTGRMQPGFVGSLKGLQLGQGFKTSPVEQGEAAEVSVLPLS